VPTGSPSLIVGEGGKLLSDVPPPAPFWIGISGRGYRLAQRAKAKAN